MFIRFHTYILQFGYFDVFSIPVWTIDWNTNLFCVLFSPYLVSQKSWQHGSQMFAVLLRPSYHLWVNIRLPAGAYGVGNMKRPGGHVIWQVVSYDNRSALGFLPAPVQGANLNALVPCFAVGTYLRCERPETDILSWSKLQLSHCFANQKLRMDHPFSLPSSWRSNRQGTLTSLQETRLQILTAKQFG